ncbi:MAG TPA: S8 family peptidase, partial [Pyrinomonadaceae bacterium]
ALKGLGATVLYRTQRVSNAIAVRVAAGDVVKLRQLSGVKAVRALPTWRRQNATSVHLIEAPVLWDSSGIDVTGRSITIGIIDTGIDYLHSDFGGTGALANYQANNRASNADGFFPTAKVVGGFDFAGDSYNGNNPPAPDPDPMDCNGHGTHVAGTVGGSTYGVAKGVTLHAVRVLDCAGNGTDSTVVAGVDWVTANHASPAVANMSLGGGASSTIDTAVQNSIASGVTYAVAAGNDGLNACNYSPARVAAAITVGNSNSSDVRASTSNYGSCLDIFAPGSSITSAWNTSNTATNTISGTSMASPHVAGVAALYLQNNTTASPATVASAITTTATSGRLTGIGTGSPNLLLYSLLTTGGGTGGAPCTSCEAYSGSLSGTGAVQYQPSGTYYYSSVSGVHKGWLRGPTSGADFDLYLQKWNGSTWVNVASGTSATSNEDVSYSGTAGYYMWQVYSYSGSGSYNFWMQRP